MYVYIHIYLHIYIWYILYIYLCLGLPESLGVSCLGWNGIKLRDIPSFGWLLKNRDWDPISASKRCGYACFKADFFGGERKTGQNCKSISRTYTHTSMRAYDNFGTLQVGIFPLRLCSQASPTTPVLRYTPASHRQRARFHSQVSLFIGPSEKIQN